MATTFRKAQWFGLGITSLAGIFTIAFYLIVLPRSLSILNTNVVMITSLSAEASYNIGDEISVTMIFDPTVIGGEATGYYLKASSPIKVFYQTEAIGLSNTKVFTLTRSFSADVPVESLTIRAEVTIESKVYYNSITVSVIDPNEITTEVVTTTAEATTPGFELPAIIIAIVVIGVIKKRWEEMD